MADTLEQVLADERRIGRGLAETALDNALRSIRIRVLAEDASAGNEGAAAHLADELDAIQAEADLETALRRSERPLRAVTALMRLEIMERDGGRCAYCGTDAGPWEIDHRLPHSRGGSDDPANLSLACTPCNREKGTMTPEEFMESRANG